MAGALIGEALISASIQVICDRIASPEFSDLFRPKKLDKPLLMKLKTTLLTLNVVLDDAEEKQIENPAVREWLDELKHAVFDAEDLLDEINYEALRCELEGDAQTADKLTKKVRNLLSTSRNKFYQSMNVKIQDLLRKLEDFVHLKGALGLTEVVGRKVSQRTPTTSLVHEPCVYGRDEDKQNLLKELLSDDASEENVSVIPIVGMGGIGKTTLARTLYNDNKVKKHFTLKAWACVSEDYDAIRVTKTLLESVTSKPCNTTNLNLLQVELSEELRGKKFLFVLDDLWNEKYTDWNYLQTPFTSGARGSKVLVTTRSKNIASFMQNVPIHTLKPLSHEDCWFLLAKHANVNSSSDPRLEEIGKKIARKCNGLPLAAQTLGGVLRSRPNSEVWNRVLNSSIWELPYEKSDILPALGLSYHYLPAKLKRCFIYCSIFPKDYEFKVEDVVFLWMAEGLIPQAENGNSMEEVAKEYFDELLFRSLFQTFRKSSFVMHDLINDLAVFMSKGFCSRREEREPHEVERVRHLSYAREKIDVANKFEPLKGAKCLRTFLSISLKPYYNFQKYYVSKKVLHNLLPSLTCLRALSLSCYANVTELPDSIKKLIHLRYLDLSNSAIETLPRVLCSLYNLQTLLLSNCSRLVELPADLRKLINLQKLMLEGCESLTKLPVDMWKLINLHHLDVSGTKIAEMPMQMSTLRSLRTLPSFIVGKSTGSTIGELGELPHLRGKLSILRLRNVLDARDALQANLKDKKDLKELELEWSDEDADDSQKEKDVLEKLQPWVNLEKLTISGYGGKDFPNWLGGSSLSNIQVMCISDCSNCSSLPPLGRLPTLKELCIRRMKLVKTIDVEFYGSTGSSVIQPFKSLEKLEFSWMAEWEEWVPSGSGGADFPCLQKLVLDECPKLRGSLPCKLPCLKKLRVEGCGVLHDQRATTATSVNMHYKSLENLKIGEGFQTYVRRREGLPLAAQTFGGVLSLQETKLLSRLEIYCSNDIQCLPNISRLQSLSLSYCRTLKSFPEDGLPTTLTYLYIDTCSRLELPHEMLAKLTSLGHLVISHSCDSMRSFPLGIFPKLRSLLFWDCKNLESFSLIEEEGVDENLSRLRIAHCPNLVCFPQGGLPTPNLTELEFIGCKKLKSLPERIHTLTALRELKMDNLPNLESIAEDGGLPPNLRDFSIKNCEILRAPSSSVGDYCKWGLQRLVSLEIGGRGSDEILETFLKQQLLPTTLQRLEISQLSSPKSLDAKGLKQLTSLSFLSISDCSALEKRYKKKTGKAWANISHIPCIKIGEEVII